MSLYVDEWLFLCYNIELIYQQVVGVISPYNNGFKNASKMLNNAEANELIKKKQFEEAHSKTTNCRSEYCVKGLLYYNTEKRNHLLLSAEKLCYSKTSIEHLKSFTVDNWNSDNVTVEDIRELETIEAYVHENTPKWENNLLTKIGNFITDKD